MNQRFVPPLTIARNASAAKASTTPNSAAYRVITQNPGDRVMATTSAPEGDASLGSGCGCLLTIEPS